jgi:hypothetical protein
MVYLTDGWWVDDPDPELSRHQTRRPGGAPRRSDKKLADHGCAPEAIKLIRALDDLIDARYGSRREFLEDLRQRFRVEISEKTLSNQMGGDVRHRMGPDWNYVGLIVVSCVPPERRILELARFAGLWAHARNEPRPAGYGGAIFPAVTAADQMEHVKALVAGFPAVTHRNCPRHDRVNQIRYLFRSLLAAAVPWLAAIVVFHAAIGAPAVQVGLIAASGAILILSISLRVGAFLPVSSDRGMHLVEPSQPVWLPASFDVWPGSEIMFDGPFFQHWTPSTPTEPKPARWPWPTRNTLEWTLQAGEAIVAPLGPRRPEWWIDLRSALNHELRVCTEGGLRLLDDIGQQPDDETEQGSRSEDFLGDDTADHPDSPDNHSGPYPLVEWAILDWKGTLYATGLLAPHPVWRVPVAIPGAGVRMQVCGDGDEALPLPTYLVKLGGLVRVPWPGQITVLLRRLDTVTRPVRVKWEKAGGHIHAFTVRR